MTYPQPDASLGRLRWSASSGSFVDDLSRRLEVSILDDSVWCLEMRLDECVPGFRRQPFTGRQAELTAVTPEWRETEGILETRCRHETLTIDPRTAEFSLFRKGQRVFASTEAPFAHLPQAVELQSGISSPKRPQIRIEFDGLKQPPSFRTHVVRLCAKRPAGAVIGLPGAAGEFNRNGYRFELYNTDNGPIVPDRRPLYQSWPVLFFPVQGQWVGLFYDNPSRTFVDLGDFYPDLLFFESVTNNQRLYLLSGNSLQEVSTKMCTLLGVPKPVPLWAFGYQQCRWSYMCAEDILGIADRLRTEHIPCDALYYDIDYMDGFRVFTNHPDRFPDLPASVHALRERKFHAVCIVDPGVKADPEFPIFQKMQTLPCLMTAEGANFPVTVWPGQCVLPDFGAEATRDYWAAVQTDWLTRHEFSGIWNDMNEPSNFDGGNMRTSQAFTARGPITNEWNLYGYYMARASRLGWEQARGTDPGLIITRSGYPGVQQYAIIWHGDNHSWWEHLRLALDQLITYSLCGAFYTGADVPGFNDSPTDDLAVRFFQLGAFMPFFRGHSVCIAKDKEPYAFSPAAKKLIKEAIELRYSLLREWISGMTRCFEQSTAPLTPVFTPEGDPVRDQILLFDKFLAAPVVERDALRRIVYLPPGGWYRFGNHENRLEGGRWITEEITLASIPLFVREGSLVVRNSVRDTVEETLEAEERTETYPDRNGQARGWYFTPQQGAAGGDGSLRERTA